MCAASPTLARPIKPNEPSKVRPEWAVSVASRRAPSTALDGLRRPPKAPEGFRLGSARRGASKVRENFNWSRERKTNSNRADTRRSWKPLRCRARDKNAADCSGARLTVFQINCSGPGRPKRPKRPTRLAGCCKQQPFGRFMCV